MKNNIANLPETYFSKITDASSKLDHIYYSASIEQAIECEALSSSATDHLPVMAKVNLEGSKANGRNSMKVINKRSFKNFSQEDFNEDLRNEKWEKLDDATSVDDMVDSYENTITRLLNKHAPIKAFKQYNNYRGGLSDGVRKLMKERNNARKTRDPTYKILRNKCFNAIRREKKDAAAKVLKDNPNNIWNLYKFI